MAHKDYHARVSIVLVSRDEPRIRHWAPNFDAAKILRRRLARDHKMSVRDFKLTRVWVDRTRRTLPDFLNKLEKSYGNQ